MNFKRARNEEQRTERRRQILKTAAAMLAEMPVAKLSLNELSRRVGLAKVNVLRYFDSREAVLLQLLDAEVQDWIAELERSFQPSEGAPRERGDRLAEILAESMARRPVLCDLISAQAAVLEHNISTEVAIRHKYAAKHSMQALVQLVLRHVPELGAHGAPRVVEATLLMATAAWPCDRPSEAMLAAYASEPALAAMRLDFTEVMRRTVEVTISGLLARQKEPTSASPRP
ncbi:TetR/AcrR family transcriptional regulator [Nonomuraea guangzhouensis]|uniref:TetR/AcrR family transcriptional regulator n=1 Tax=Nonomuraea guangzhouensis TaxID=1291555 RepID=A0ABW4G7L6_9ACTN|nr:TetR/AcrR family transcriptional regulator [Nonomuraea guangzhouensis]